MHACMHACMYECVYACMHVCICYVCSHVNMCVPVYRYRNRDHVEVDPRRSDHKLLLKGPMMV